MTQLHLWKVYNFLAQKNNWINVSTLEELQAECTKHLIILRAAMLDVQNANTMCTLYSQGTDYYEGIKFFVKLVDNNITEYYSRPPADFKIADATYVRRDLGTDEILEYYLEQKDKEFKYNIDGELLQTNYFISGGYRNLPPEYQTASLANYPKNYQIFLYAEKPYGKIVEIDCLAPRPN